jgi:ABC-type multidrug transport system fused ATPase/permease subunit
MYLLSHCWTRIACHDIFELLDRQSKIDPFDKTHDTDVEVVLECDKGIVFENMEFAYPERPNTMVLKGLSFTVEAGQKIALVGPSGSAKSTVMGLLLRFYDPNSGRVLVGGKDIRELDVSAWRAVQG